MTSKWPIYIQPTEEEIQARTVIAENFPANYLLENLEKLFRCLGRVRSFSVRNPQDPNLPGSSRDILTISEGWWGTKRTISGLYAIVEYETREEANRAIRFLKPDPYEKDGFRICLREEYSVASEEDDMDIDSNLGRDGMRSLKKGRGRLIEGPLTKLARHQTWRKIHEAPSASQWEKRAGFRHSFD